MSARGLCAWGVVAAALGAAGCTIDIPSGRYVCSDEAPTCPPGQRCVSGRCVTGNETADAGSADAAIDAGRLDAAMPQDAAVEDAGHDGGADSGVAPVHCPPLDPPLDGSVEPATGDAGDVATYACDPGHVLVGNGGSNTRTCQSDGTWSGVAPTCEAVASACTPNPCLNGGVCTPTSDSFSCMCAMGHDGPTCAVRVTCAPALTAPAHGSVDRTTGAYMDVATYSCDPGYLPSSATMRVCQADGTWSGVAPTCVAGGCSPALTAPTHGSVDRTSGTAGDVATYSCDPGFTLVGDATRTCGTDGMWTGTAPSCAGAPCSPALTAPTNGSVDRTTGGTGDVATHTCDAGYVVEGVHTCDAVGCHLETTATQTCQADGTWTGATPTCIAGVWAVGAGGAILRYNGVRWVRVPSDTSDVLLDVWGASPTDAWAVGFNGTIVHWDGATWSAVGSGTSERLEGVSGSSERDVWAVGWNGAVRHWDGVSWSGVASGTTGTLSQAWVASASDAWIVGTRPMLGHGAFHRWQGTAWTEFTPSTYYGSSFSGVWGVASNDIWAVNNGASAYRWDGAVWAAVPLPSTAQLEDVWASSATDVWTVGLVSDTTVRGVILRGDGTTWTSIAHPVSSFGGCDRFTGVWGTSATDVWVVGQCSLIHWDGGAMTAADTSLLSGGAPTLHAIWGPG